MKKLILPILLILDTVIFCTEFGIQHETRKKDSGTMIVPPPTIPEDHGPINKDNGEIGLI
jgi:hypothetical protein